ncbi:MAG: DUF3667 domain-containing protein [Pseudomonadota bacterium]
MADLDDIEGEDAGESADAPAQGETSPPSEAPTGHAAPAPACLSCGNPAGGVFCPWCGQKNDDLRRSSLVLVRDFLRDTFGFDSRMWRTLGLLAISPGIVPKNYAHGRRSRFTPPVRLFLVVSFLFFMTIALTNTLFLGLEMQFRDVTAEELATAREAAAEAGVELSPAMEMCSFETTPRFFVKESNLNTDRERVESCMDSANTMVARQLADAENLTVDGEPVDSRQREALGQYIGRFFDGVSWVVTDPRAFNDRFNDWLPRILFLMTPALALILTLFLRREALVFDHLILSFYTHAVGFAVIALSLVAAQFGAPLMGLAAFTVIAIYYVAALKRAYGRGWTKTLWTASISGLIYIVILLTILTATLSSLVWQATA